MKYFKPSEFNCLCCGLNHMSPVFCELIDVARHFSGVPYWILSGYRCPSHNKAVGSTSMNHVSGYASDIRATTNVERAKIVKGLYKAGFKRIGIYVAHGYIHADIFPGPESLWGIDGT